LPNASFIGFTGTPIEAAMSMAAPFARSVPDYDYLLQAAEVAAPRLGIELTSIRIENDASGVRGHHMRVWSSSVEGIVRSEAERLIAARGSMALSFARRQVQKFREQGKHGLARQCALLAVYIANNFPQDPSR
jgi:hypothetical protein